MRRSDRASLLLALFLAAACDRAGSSVPDAGDPPPDASRPDAGALDVAIALPQATRGALFANPAVWSTIPLRVAISGADAAKVRAVSARIDLTAHAAVASGQDGLWIAQVGIEGLPDGVRSLEVVAHAESGEQVRATVEAHLVRTGARLTDWTQAGPANLPKLHRIGERLVLTWTDRSLADRRAEAWMQDLDGAGRLVGDRKALVGGTEDTLYARTAVGDGTVGVLYQAPGHPYRNFFKIVDLEGRELIPPRALDPAGEVGGVGGDLSYDGGAYVAVWKIGQVGAARLAWARFDEQTGAMTGPVTVAQSGDGDPVGGFDEFLDFRVASFSGTSMVGFVRERNDVLLRQMIPKSQYALVAADGTVTGPVYAGDCESDSSWHHEARVFAAGGRLLGLWTAEDLSDTDLNPPWRFFGAWHDGAATFPVPATLVDRPNARFDPVFVPHPEQLGVLIWGDERAYTTEPASPRIKMYAAPLSSDLKTGREIVLNSAVLFSGVSYTTATTVSTSVPVVWVDNRRSPTFMDPRPELYFDVLWY